MTIREGETMTTQSAGEPLNIVGPNQWVVPSAPVLPEGKMHLPAIGLIELSTEIVMQAEMRAFIPGLDPGLYTTRVRFSDHPDVNGLAEMEGHLADAAALLPGSEWLDAIVFGCTSGSVIISPERIAELAGRNHPGVPVLTPITAVVAGLNVMNCKRIAIVTPYPREVNFLLHDFLTAQGIEIVGGVTFEFDSGYSMSRIAPSDLLEAALRADRPEADAIFICCTALQVSPIIEELEQRTGKPAISSNQALIWQCCGAAGISNINGRGTLLKHNSGASVKAADKSHASL